VLLLVVALVPWALLVVLLVEVAKQQPCLLLGLLLGLLPLLLREPHRPPADWHRGDQPLLFDLSLVLAQLRRPAPDVLGSGKDTQTEGKA
jgi:glucose-6-phosphate-specific signal transduction histidine kinase